jgi:hypothetical protein
MKKKRLLYVKDIGCGKMVNYTYSTKSKMSSGIWNVQTSLNPYKLHSYGQVMKMFFMDIDQVSPLRTLMVRIIG